MQTGPLVMLAPVLITTVLVLVNSVFVAAEFAIIGVRRTQIEQLARQGNARASRVLAVLESPYTQDRYIATAQLGITLASLGLGMYAEPRIAHFIEPYLGRITGISPGPAFTHALATILALTVLIYLHVVLGEMAPKSLALRAPLRSALAVIDMMNWAQRLLALPVSTLNALGAALLRLLRVYSPSEYTRLHSPQELVQIISESSISGLLNDKERMLLLGVLDFSDRNINQIMTPRNRLNAIAHDAALNDVLSHVTASRFSRFPVYQDNLDHIIGILHVKDLAPQQMRPSDNFDLRRVLHQAHHLPENAGLESLLHSFKKGQSHMAIVSDEYGGTAGIVTRKDMVEEIVGKMRDEFDVGLEPLRNIARGVLEIAGDYLVEDLQELVSLGAPDGLPPVETVSGLLMTWLGRPPKTGDRYTHMETTFTVLAVTGHAAARVRIEFTAPTED